MSMPGVTISISHGQDDGSGPRFCDLHVRAGWLELVVRIVGSDIVTLEVIEGEMTFGRFRPQGSGGGEVRGAAAPASW